MDFTTRDDNSKLYLPLIFNINPSEKLIFILNDNYYGNNYANGYLLEYCKLNGNQCEYNGIIKTVTFEKGEKYKIKHNCNSNFKFKSFLSIDIFELEINNIQLFDLSSNNKDQYFITNVKNYENIYIYFNAAESNYFYTKFISENEMKTIDKNINEYEFDSESTFQGNIFLFEKKNDYLIIKVKYRSYNNDKGTLGIFSKIYNIEPGEIIEIDKGTKTLIKYLQKESGIYFLVSSYENMKLLENYYPINTNFTNFMELYSSFDNKLIYVDSTNEITKIKLFKNEFHYDKMQFNFYYNDNMKPYFDIYGPDSLFMRIFSQSSDLMLKSYYIYGLKENYYLYKKNYYENIDFYQYNKELDAFSNISQFETPYYKNLNEYNLINNDLLIISGFQLFTFFNTYDSLLEFYLQKVNDSAHITINQRMFNYQNLVKILNENKKYFLDFTVDHLIKLDNKYLDAQVIFIDSNGTEYALNKSNKIIRNLKGNNITLISTKKALIYFYKKINDFSNIEELNFDKSQKGKIMKFNIINMNNDSELVNINIIKDFGFSGYYTMISKKSWIRVSGNKNIYTVYIENLYDKLKNEDLYENEGEKFIIYIDSINKEKFEINNITYIDNLLNIKNKYNFQLIPANSNGVIILNVLNNIYKLYQFMMPKNKEIKFKIESSNGDFSQSYPKIEYPYKVTINESKILRLNENANNEILIHSFESDNEFLFLYCLNEYIYDYSYPNYEILSIFEIKKNVLQIKFESISNAVIKYYILIAKKDQLNNNESFSDIFYISKLFINNDFNSIYVKNISTSPISDSGYLKSEDIDISKLNINNNDELIFNIIGFYNDFSNKFPKLYESKESIQRVLELNLEEYVNFKLEDKNIFKFEYKNLRVGKQILYFYFNNALYLHIYLTELNGESKEIFYSRYYNNIDYLINSGIYYLEFYPLYVGTEYKNEGSFIVILSGLIDIIDFSKNSYSNKKSIKLDNSADIENANKYYIVKNLKENKKVIFTYKSEASTYLSEGPFIICNNNSNICNDNVESYNFEKGNEYTIFINFIVIYPKYGNYYYYYPTFKFYSESNSDSNSLIYIICGCAFGFIIILIVLFLIIRYFKKKKQKTDFIKETKTLNNENLLSTE